MDFPVLNIFCWRLHIPFNWYLDCSFFQPFYFHVTWFYYLAWGWLLSYVKQTMQIFHINYIVAMFMGGFSFHFRILLGQNDEGSKQFSRFTSALKKKNRMECESLIISKIKRKARVFNWFMRLADKFASNFIWNDQIFRTDHLI